MELYIGTIKKNNNKNTVTYNQIKHVQLHNLSECKLRIT